VFIKPPGWFPAHLGGFKPAPEIDTLNYKKYDYVYEKQLLFYVSIQFLVALASGSALLFLFHKMEMTIIVIAAIFTIFSLLTCGALLEHKKWVRYFEFSRLVSSLIALYWFSNLPFFYVFSISIAIIQISSLIWFYYLKTSSANVTETSKI